LKYILICAAFVGLIAWCILSVRETFSIRTGENVTRVDWLPQKASNVSYYLNYHFKAYEFDISEDDFLAWRPEVFYEIDEPYTILRWQARLVDYPDIPPDISATDMQAAIEEYENRTSATVSVGLLYEEWGTNGGGSVWVFDREKSRGYHRYSPR
jgi:hypothetical protein